jgi:hypothetical protein
MASSSRHDLSLAPHLSNRGYHITQTKHDAGHLDAMDSFGYRVKYVYPWYLDASIYRYLGKLLGLVRRWVLYSIREFFGHIIEPGSLSYMTLDP